VAGTAWEGFKCEFAVSPEDVIDSEDYATSWKENEFDTCGAIRPIAFMEAGLQQYTDGIVVVLFSA
jgi:hypothetical protein